MEEKEKIRSSAPSSGETIRDLAIDDVCNVKATSFSYVKQIYTDH